MRPPVPTPTPAAADERAAAAATAEVDTPPDGQARPAVIWLDNGVLRLGFVPQAGGRLLSVQLHGQETLWRDADVLDDALHPVGAAVIGPHDGPMSAWVNLGGDKTWPAPQGWSGPTEWAGPPDPVLDSGPYDWALDSTAEGAVVLTLTSGDDPRTGLRLTRRIALAPGAAAYDVRLTATNTADREVTWALWNVTQRAAGEPGSGGVRVGVDPRDPRTVELAVGTAAPTSQVSDPGVVTLPHQDVVGKLGFPTATGWLAHAARGTTTTQVVEVDAAGEYPDGGSRVEVWMEYPLDTPLAHLGDLRPSHRIVEVEVLGPLTTLAPGAGTTLDFRCATTTGEDAVDAVAPAGHWSGAGRTPSEQVHFHPYVDGVLHPAADPDLVLARVRAGHRVAVAIDLPPGTPLAVQSGRAGDAALPAGVLPAAASTDPGAPS